MKTKPQKCTLVSCTQLKTVFIISVSCQLKKYKNVEKEKSLVAVHLTNIEPRYKNNKNIKKKINKITIKKFDKI